MATISLVSMAIFVCVITYLYKNGEEENGKRTKIISHKYCKLCAKRTTIYITSQQVKSCVGFGFIRIIKVLTVLRLISQLLVEI
jgi:hypothetical protein